MNTNWCIETESTASQYFISDTEAWNTLRKQLKTTAQGHAILYISESCEIAYNQ